MLRDRGAAAVTAICLLAAPAGLARLDAAFPGASVRGVPGAVNAPVGGRGLTPVGDLDADRQHKLHARRRVAFDEPIEGLPGHVLHHDPGFIALLADLVDRAYIGVLDGGRQPRFPKHARAHLLGRVRAALEDFEHDGAHQLRIFRQEHNTRTAGTEAALELVMLDHAVLHGYVQCSGKELRLWLR